MTDLVTRLRAREGGGDEEEILLREAADEIERLLEREAELQAECGYTESINTLEIERLRAAAMPFAEHGWYDAELEDDNCPLVRHSGPITVGHWRALRLALRMKP